MGMNPAWTPTQQSLYHTLTHWRDYSPSEARRIVENKFAGSVDKSGSSAGDTEKRGA